MSPKSHPRSGDSLLNTLESPQNADHEQTRVVTPRKALLSHLSYAPQDQRTAVADSRYSPESR